MTENEAPGLSEKIKSKIDYLSTITFKNAKVQGNYSRQEDPACVISAQPPNTPHPYRLFPVSPRRPFLIDCLLYSEQRLLAKE